MKPIDNVLHICPNCLENPKCYWGGFICILQNQKENQSQEKPCNLEIDFKNCPLNESNLRNVL